MNFFPLWTEAVSGGWQVSPRHPLSSSGGAGRDPDKIIIVLSAFDMKRTFLWNTLYSPPFLHEHEGGGGSSLPPPRRVRCSAPSLRRQGGAGGAPPHHTQPRFCWVLPAPRANWVTCSTYSPLNIFKYFFYITVDYNFTWLGKRMENHMSRNWRWRLSLNWRNADF